jgi:hypothetical protein
LRDFEASGNSEDAPETCTGWLVRMRKSQMKKTSAFLGIWLLAGLLPVAVEAQLTGAQSLQDAPASSGTSAAPTGKHLLSQEVQLTGEETWVDTGIDVHAGEHVVVNVTGTLRYADQQTDSGPAGVTRGFRDLIRVLPYNGAGRGAVIGRIGDKDTAQSFLIGAKRDVIAPTDGRLSVAINQTTSDTGTGNYKIQIEVYAADASSTYAVAKHVTSMPGIDNALFTKIPRRIGDKQGNAGDMVNFLIIGSEAAMQNAFTTAGWVKVDADVRATILHGFIESMSKESYLTMPMSQLYLFGRAQDYGWAHAEPISVVASRNHLRIWKAPFLVNGQVVWVGAATHDIGFERDQRNNGLTHKIDPDIDLERDYLEKTFTSTGLVKELMHFLPESPMQEAKTATGGSFHSNGQVLVMKVAEVSKDAQGTAQQ